MDQVLLQEENRPLGLALGGGAALGFAHIGVIRELERRCVTVDLVAGTSIGAIIGACLAAGLVEELESVARSIRVGTVLRYLDPSFARGALIGGRSIERTLYDYFGDRRIESLDIPFAAVAGDLLTGETVTITKGPVVEALMASIAIPVIFQPVELNDRLLVDGSLVEPTPIRTAREMGARRVIAVDLTTDYESRITKLKNGQRLPIAANFHIARASMWMLIKSFSEANRASHPADVMIAPRVGHVDAANFTRAHELIVTGERAARRAFDDVAVEAMA